MRLSVFAAVTVAALGVISSNTFATANLLYSNGPFITSPNGGTGAIAGLPLSKAETYNSVATPGAAAALAFGTKLAEDFTVPAGGWDVASFKVFAFQNYPSSATTWSQTITKVSLNLWTATPYTSDSPDLPAGTTIPQPVLAQAVSFDVTGQGEFVAHRVSGSSTTTVRPVYSFTLPATAFTNNGHLDAGTYWLEMQFDGIGATTNNVYVPLVSPRTDAVNLNTRQYAVPLAGIPTTWFEGREGYVNAANPGRPYALPFEVVGTPEPTTLATIGATLSIAAIRRKRR
jgi:hypothetical protein